MLYVLHKDGKLFRGLPEGQKPKFNQRRKTFVYVTEAAAEGVRTSLPSTRDIDIEPYFSLGEIEAAGHKIGMSFGGDGDDGQMLLDQLLGDGD